MSCFDVNRRKGAYRHQQALRILMGLCALGILYSGITLLKSNREYAYGDLVYEDVRLEQKNPKRISSSADASSTVGVDFPALVQINPNVVAWISSEASIIDYPVVQGDDNVYYLTHLFNGAENKLGCLFIDYRNSGDFSDKNTIIYGHNMKDGSMFSSLIGYLDQSYYDSHPVMQIYTPQGSYNLELFAGIVGDGDYEFVQLSFGEDSEFLSYIAGLKANSTFQSNVEVLSKDQIVTLSTCSYSFDNARYALFGKLSKK